MSKRFTEDMVGFLPEDIINQSYLIGLRGSATVYLDISELEEFDLLIVSDTLTAEEFHTLTAELQEEQEIVLDVQVLTLEEFHTLFRVASLEVTEALTNTLMYDEGVIQPYLDVLATEAYEKLFELECYLVLKNQIKQIYKSRPSKFYSKAYYLYSLLNDKTASCLEFYLIADKRKNHAKVYQEIRKYGVVDLTELTEMGVFRDDGDIKAHYMQYKQSSQKELDEYFKQYQQTQHT